LSFEVLELIGKDIGKVAHDSGIADEGIDILPDEQRLWI
jgi:hypothetical protein